jgi:CubicO group peptidase (beta-lactamase class C family)
MARRNPGVFARVIEEFERQFVEYPVGTGAALAIYLDQELVVDRWGGDSTPATSWDRDTLSVTFSASKGVSVAAVLSLVASGQLDVDAPVARYWPAFGAAGKAGVTVADLLSHQAGLPYWDGYLDMVTAESPPSAWLREDDIAAALAKAATVPTARGRFTYHAITFGWLLHGLTFAVTGGSLGELFVAELAEPFDLDLHFGLLQHDSPRVALAVADPNAVMDEPDPDPEVTAKSLLRSARGLDYLHNLDLINSPAFHAVPQGACNGIGTARALAGVYAATGASSYLERARDRFTRPVLRIPGPGPRRDQGLGFQVRMPTPWNDRDTAFGHTGAGGGIAFFDPRLRLAFAFTTNHLVFGADDRLDRLRSAMAADLRPQA